LDTSENERSRATSVMISSVQEPDFRNFLGRSLEDFFSKESMRIFEPYFENEFGRI